MGWTCGRLTPTLAGMRCLSTLQNILTPAPLVIMQEVHVGALASFQAPWVLASQLPIWSNTVELSEAQKIQWGTKWEGPKRKYTNNVHFFILANIKVEVYPLIPNILGAGRKYQKPAMKLSTCLGITGSRADVLFDKISSKLVQRKVNGKNKRCILCRKPFQSYLFDGES